MPGSGTSRLPLALSGHSDPSLLFERWYGPILAAVRTEAGSIATYSVTAVAVAVAVTVGATERGSDGASCGVGGSDGPAVWGASQRPDRRTEKGDAHRVKLRGNTGGGLGLAGVSSGSSPREGGSELTDARSCVAVYIGWHRVAFASGALFSVSLSADCQFRDLHVSRETCLLMSQTVPGGEHFHVRTCVRQRGVRWVSKVDQDVAVWRSIRGGPAPGLVWGSGRGIDHAVCVSGNRSPPAGIQTRGGSRGVGRPSREIAGWA